MISEKNVMKKFFCKLGLRVVDLILDVVDRHNAASSGKVPQSAAGMLKAEDLKESRGVPVAEWAEGVLAKHVPVVEVEVTLYGGPADGWVERIAAGKRWPEMMLVKVDAEVHAYEQISGRAVYRHVRKVGSLGNDFKKH